MSSGPPELKLPAPGDPENPNEERNPAGNGGVCPIVGIGASAGGLEAFTELLKHLPLDTGMGFVLVQHLDPQHESALAQLLSRTTSLSVREVTDNLRVEANHVYVIPPNANLTIKQGVLKLQPRQQARTPHRSIDFFFESLAEDQRERAIGVILSGTATDGTLGLEAIKAEGGIAFAQDDSARYDSMPRSAVAAGCVDFVLSPQDIAKELVRIAKHPYVVGQLSEPPIAAEGDRAAATEHEDDATPLPPGGHKTPRTGARQARAEAEAAGGKAVGDNGFKKILLLLRNHCGVDFSLYKSTTIQRRVTRRVVLNRQNTLKDYADFLRGNVKELDALYSDVLISVTSFFRNPEAFDVLKSKVFPKLLQQRGEEPIRVWVLGCSTGQEAYSIAMAFVESAENAPRMRKLQVFATDLNDALLEKARHGLYAKSLAQDVSPERLRRFFVEEEGGYRIVKLLREMVVFARQNLINDPPFSRLDLISCRNLLIYLEPSLQKRALPTFHYALKPEGYLLLGASESIGSFTDLFEPADKKHKIYSKKAAPTRPSQLPVGKTRGEEHSLRRPRQVVTPVAIGTGQGHQEEGLRSELNAQREADRISVNQFAPPGVLINEELQILQFRGPTSAYLEPPTGKATFDVLKMAREGLMLPLRTAINEANRENKPVRKENLRVDQNGSPRTVNLEVIPLKNLRERCFLILFEDGEKAHRSVASKPPQPDDTPSGESTGGPAATKESRRLAELESELAETRDYLQTIQEQQEAANEELQASNEEVQSANEELQSINEELETSKEELESSNEELTVVNEEMGHRNAELNRLNSDLVNVQTSAQLAIVLLGRDLTIRRFSSQAEKQFNLLATDIGRPFGHVRHNLIFEDRRVQGANAPSDPGPEKTDRRQPDLSAKSTRQATGSGESAIDLESFIAGVITNVREREREVRDKEGRWYSLRVRPYLTVDNRVDGAVVVLVEVSDLKRTQQAIAGERDYAEAIISTIPDPLVILDANLRVYKANEAFYSTFKVQPAESQGRLIYDISNRQWNVPKLRQMLEEILPGKRSFDHFEVKQAFEKIGQRTMLLNARTMGDTSHPARILLGIQDITDVLEFQAAAQESQNRYQALIEASAQIVWTTDAGGLGMEESPSWRAFTGQSYEQWKGLGWLNALHPDDRERVRELWERAVAERNAVETEYRIWHISGDWRWMSVRAVPVLRADGSVHQWVGMNIDITERKRGEEARARLAAIVESSDDVIVSKDLNGFITSWNRGAERLFGYTAQEVVGKPATILIPPELAGEEPSILERVRRGERIEQYETVRRCKDGTLLDVSLMVSPVVDGQGQVVGASKIARNITERKRAEDRLRESEERFAQFMRHLPGLAWIKNAEGRYLYANDAAELAFGSRLAELKDKTDHDLFPAETAVQFTMNDQRALASGSGIQTIETLKHADGTVRHSIVSKFPVPGRDGKETLIGGVAFDVTDQKEAEERVRESEQRFRLLADSVPVLIWVNGLDGCEFVNREYSQFVGRSMEEIQQMKWATSLHREDADAYLEAYRQAFEARKPFEAQVRLRRADGEYRWMKSAGLPRVAIDGRLLGYVGCSLDITDVKQYHEALSEADRRKNEFLAMLAHELRNPLAPIRNALEIIRRNKDNGQTIQATSEMMERQISQMARLVDDLLDVSRISRGKIELRREPIELASALNHALDTSRPMAEAKGINLIVSLPSHPVYVNADPIRLAQVVGNLLNNACKFTGDGGQVWLTIELASVGGDSPEVILIRVRDTGIGIAADQLDRVFDMFVQLDTSLERSVSGLGIGLTLAKNLVGLHGGTMEVHSAGAGQGSEFVVRLPILVEAPEQPRLEAAVSDVKTSPGRRILVVDDNEDSAESLTILLSLAGNETHTAYDGLEALEAAEAFKPDVILLDIGLPKLNGYEVAHKIREQPWGQTMVLVALTGWGQEEDRRRSRDAGFNHHLTKPVDPPALTRLLARLSQAQSAS